MARRRFIVMRLHGGFWMYYAGRNEALGAARWTDRSQAHEFETKREAKIIADSTGGFVQHAREKVSG